MRNGIFREDVCWKAADMRGQVAKTVVDQFWIEGKPVKRVVANAEILVCLYMNVTFYFINRYYPNLTWFAQLIKINLFSNFVNFFSISFFID